MNSLYNLQDQKLFEEAISYLVKNIECGGHNPKPVILHSIRVAMFLYNHGYSGQIVVAALLHDLLEDSDCSVDEIRVKFGKQVAEIVSALTFDQTITDRMLRCRNEIDKAIAYGKEASIIKAADLLDNSNYYNLTSVELRSILRKKFEYFVVQAKAELEKEPIWKYLIEREREF